MPYQQPASVGWPVSVDIGSAAMALYRFAQAAPTTPKLPLSAKVIALCERISTLKPQFLPFIAMPEKYKAGYCHVNVLHHVKQHGGHQICGWMIWKGAKFNEAEFHSVWQSGENSPLLDITPRVDAEAEILFLPDPAAKLTLVGNVDYGLANRTDIPGCPYTAGKAPYGTPTYPIDYDLDPPMIAEMKRLGFKKLSQAIGLAAFD